MRTRMEISAALGAAEGHLLALRNLRAKRLEDNGDLGCFISPKEITDAEKDVETLESLYSLAKLR